MKLSFLVAFLLILTCNFSFAQENESNATSKYMAVGLSVTNSENSTFYKRSYPSIEVGLMKKNLSLGLVLGRSDLNDIKNNTAENFFYELKSAVSIPLESNVSAYGIAGIGNYFSTDRIFIEYGIGASYSANKLSYFVQASNWDGFWYVTPGISFNL